MSYSAAYYLAIGYFAIDYSTIGYSVTRHSVIDYSATGYLANATWPWLTPSLVVDATIKILAVLVRGPSSGFSFA